MFASKLHHGWEYFNCFLVIQNIISSFCYLFLVDVNAPISRIPINARQGPLYYIKIKTKFP